MIYLSLLFNIRLQLKKRRNNSKKAFPCSNFNLLNFRESFLISCFERVATPHVLKKTSTSGKKSKANFRTPARVIIPTSHDLGRTNIAIDVSLKIKDKLINSLSIEEFHSHPIHSS